MSKYSQRVEDCENEKKEDARSFDDVLIESMSPTENLVKINNSINFDFSWVNEYLDPSESF